MSRANFLAYGVGLLQLWALWRMFLRLPGLAPGSTCTLGLATSHPVPAGPGGDDMSPFSLLK